LLKNKIIAIFLKIFLFSFLFDINLYQKALLFLPSKILLCFRIDADVPPKHPNPLDSSTLSSSLGKFLSFGGDL
jgi:hypothetical protein